MKKIAIIVGLLLIVTISNAQQKFSLNTANGDFIKGMFQEYGSHVTPPGYIYDGLNIYGKDGDLRSRNGRNKNNTTALGNGKAVTQLHDYSLVSGDRYAVWVSSETIYYSTGDGTYTTLFSSAVVDDADWQFVTINDEIVGGNSYDGFRWDGTTVTKSTWFAKGRIFQVYQGRTWFAGDRSFKSVIYHTGVRSNTVFHDDDGDVLQDFINSDDGDVIEGMIVIGPYLVVAKRNSTHRIYGTTSAEYGFTYTISEANNRYGCINGNTMQVLDNGNGFWLSREGFVEFDGETFVLRSEEIQPIVDLIQQTKTNLYNVEDTLSADFGSGTTIVVDTITTSGSIVVGSIAINGTTGGGNLTPSVRDSEAQSFIPTYTATVSSVGFRTGSFVKGTATITFQLRSSTYGGTVLSTGTVSTTNLSANTWETVYLSPEVTLTANTKYFLWYTSDGDGGSSNYANFKYTTANNYDRGRYWFNASTNSTTRNLDLNFKVYSTNVSTFTSQEFDLTGDVSSFSTAEISDSGTTDIVTYSVSVATYSGGQATYTTITHANNVNVTAQRYMKYRAVYSKTSATQTASMQSMKINYYTTVTLPADSVIYGEDYYVVISTASSTQNDCMLIYDENGSWWKHSGRFYCIDTFREELWAGDNSGFVWQLDNANSYNDNSSAIVSYVDFGDRDLGAREYNKMFNRAYVNYQNTGLGTLDFEYFLDKRTTSTSIDCDLDSNTGFIRRIIQFPQGTKNRYIKFKLSHSTVDQYWILNGIDLYYGLDTRW